MENPPFGMSDDDCTFLLVRTKDIKFEKVNGGLHMETASGAPVYEATVRIPLGTSPLLVDTYIQPSIMALRDAMWPKP